MSAPEKTLKWATQVAIRTLGIARCAELTHLAEASIYRWANQNEAATIPSHHALILDKECWLRAGVAPFREVYEQNAGVAADERLAAELVRIARRISPMAGIAAE